MKRSSQVGINHSLPAFWRHVLRWARKLTTAIVYQKVDPAILLQHRWHKVFYLPHTRIHNGTPWLLYTEKDEVQGAKCEGIRTSFSFLMLHWRGVTEAGLDTRIFCLISRAAASSLPVFLLEMTTLQPKGRIEIRHYHQIIRQRLLFLSEIK